MGVGNSIVNRPKEKILGVIELVALLGVVVACLGLLVFGVSGPGVRFHLWDFRLGITLVRVSAWIALGGTVLSFLALAAALVKKHRRAIALTVAGLVIGGTLLGFALNWKHRAETLPRIHDISTDPADPPTFVAIIPLRADAPNPSEYGGPEIAALQRQAYPNLAPHFMSMDPDQAFELALAAVKRMGWEIVASEPVTGRIEATDTTFWFGFKDDIVIRVRPIPVGTKLDVRSVSRVGVSDLGTNAKRIRAYIDCLRKG